MVNTEEQVISEPNVTQRRADIQANTTGFKFSFYSKQKRHNENRTMNPHFGTATQGRVRGIKIGTSAVEVVEPRRSPDRQAEWPGLSVPPRLRRALERTRLRRTGTTTVTQDTGVNSSLSYTASPTPCHFRHEGRGVHTWALFGDDPGLLAQASGLRAQVPRTDRFWVSYCMIACLIACHHTCRPVQKQPSNSPRVYTYLVRVSLYSYMMLMCVIYADSQKG